MQSWILISVFISSLVLFQTQQVLGRDQVYLPLFPQENIAKCEFEIGKSCLECSSTCPSLFETYFKKSVSEYRKDVRDFSICRSRLSFDTRAFPDWCLVDENGYYHNDKFEVSENVCMNVTSERTCIEIIDRHEKHDSFRRLIRTPEKQEFIDTVKELVTVVEERDKAALYFARNKLFWAFIDEAFEKDWVVEYEAYSNNLEDTKSRFFNPAFYNYSNWVADYYRIDRLVSKTDLHSLNVERLFVEKDTIGKIPSLITDIKALKNDIFSRKEETDKVLDEIKEIADQIFSAQMNSTNVIYEITHSRNLDGQITLLDKELLDLYVKLKSERGKLRSATVKSTFSKLRLIAVIRNLIRKISQRQKEQGCSGGQVLGLTG